MWKMTLLKTYWFGKDLNLSFEDQKPTGEYWIFNDKTWFLIFQVPMLVYWKTARIQTCQITTDTRHFCMQRLNIQGMIFSFTQTLILECLFFVRSKRISWAAVKTQEYHRHSAELAITLIHTLQSHGQGFQIMEFRLYFSSKKSGKRANVNQVDCFGNSPIHAVLFNPVINSTHLFELANLLTNS